MGWQNTVLVELDHLQCSDWSDTPCRKTQMYIHIFSLAAYRQCNLCREGNVQGYKRVDGPSEDELKKKYEEDRKNSPFSNPSRKISNLSISLL